MTKYVSVIFALHLVSMNLFAWTNGELLVWMDSDRGYAFAPAEHHDAWLSGETGKEVLVPFPATAMRAWPMLLPNKRLLRITGLSWRAPKSRGSNVRGEVNLRPYLSID